MTPDRADLLGRILAFDIDGGPATLSFARRLARENGWSPRYADRVIREYKRFVFLAVNSSRPVCPSEDVDAAWHLHLTYTRSYWQRLCTETLGRPLHHEPTKGGAAEGDKHLRMYADTLAAYREAFGEAAPADIWTPAGDRFGDDLRHRVVNTARNWVIPKRPVVRAAGGLAAAVGAVLFATGCAGGWNPFNLVGAEFLVFLIPVMIAAVCLGRVVRGSLAGPGPQPGDDACTLTWEQAAFLAGGYPRLATAAIARLVGCGALRVDGTWLERTGTPPNGLTPVEQAILTNPQTSNSKESMKAVVETVEARFADEARQLEADGFVLPKDKQIGAGCGAAVPLLLVVLLLGVPRLVMGLADHKPVAYLVATLIVGGIVGLVVTFAGFSRLTRRGQALLEAHRAKHAALKAGTAWGGGHDAGMAVALFGTAVLAGSSLAYLNTWYPRQTTDTSGGGCGTGGGCGAGGGCSGGDGGGGDGGGGGGCGGCGGGGD